MNNAANSPSAILNAQVRAMAEGDFDTWAQRFSSAGLIVDQPTRGIMTLHHNYSIARPSIVLSVGVHGDETGPIELLADIVDTLSLTPAALLTNFMICVGNLDAINAGKRFIDADLNRMFTPQRGILSEAAEATRADDIIQATTTFFQTAGSVRWHLDLHTAIRPSIYPTFAIVPNLIAQPAQENLINWLSHATIGAVVLNPKSAGTYSYFSAQHCGAAASTVELGQVSELGKNDLSQFNDVTKALNNLLRGITQIEPKNHAKIFLVAQEIIKLSDQFHLHVDRAAHNFTTMQKGDIIATDGAHRYKVEHPEEQILFPNPDVRVGLRAGLMVVRKTTTLNHDLT